MESRFFSSFSAILRVLQLLGTYPLHYVQGEALVSWNLLLYSLLLNSFFFLGAIKVLYKWKKRVLMNRIIYYLNFSSFFVLLFVFNYRLVKQFRKKDNILRSMESIERRLLALGFFYYGAPSVKLTVLTITFWIATVTMKCVCKGFKSHLKRFLSYYSQLLHTLNLFYFLSILHIVQVLFLNVSEHLEWIRLTPTNAKKKVETLETLAELHEDLCSVCFKIDKFYSPQLLLTVAGSFLNFTCNIYFLMFQKTRCRACMSLFAALVAFLHSVTVCSATATTSKRAKKFNTLLYQLMIDDKTNEISENKKLRLHISMKREVVFSACGFFNLDYTLIHSMVAAATTYLVILIQFGQPMNNEVPPEHLNATLTTSSEVSNFFTTPSWIYTTI
ncbi:Gustatory receptor 81k [Halyomorpha halys]|nr:Gustatory receptor 81k [Halyomorpha halys]